jgi:hypothetical protein
LRPRDQLSCFCVDNIVKDESWKLTFEILKFSTIATPATPATQVPMTTTSSSSKQNVPSSLPPRLSSRSVPVPAKPSPLAPSATQGTQNSEELAVCPFSFFLLVIDTILGPRTGIHCQTSGHRSLHVHSRLTNPLFILLLFPSSFTYHPIGTLFK